MTRCRRRRLPYRERPSRDREPLSRKEDASEGEAVRFREPRGGDTVSPCDRDEPLAGLDTVDDERLRRTGRTTTRPPASARNVRTPAIPSGASPRDRWNRRSAAAVAASKRPSIRLAGRPKLRNRNSSEVTSQPDVAPAEHALAEQGPPELAELAACRMTDLARRPDPVPLLEAHDPAARERPGDPVDLALVETVRAQGNLERRGLGALRSDSRPGERQGCHRRDEDHGDSAHGNRSFAAAARSFCSAGEKTFDSGRAAVQAETRRYTSRSLPSPVAQLAEHPAVNRRVVGSSPTRGVANSLHIG